GNAIKTLGKIDVPADVADIKTLEYIKTKRIEIDSVKRAVGNNKKFWEFVVEKLIDKKKGFPTRDYNRSIEVPTYVYPSALWRLLAVLRKSITPILKPDVLMTKVQLSEYEGIIDNVEAKEKSIEKEFEGLVDKSSDERLGSLIGHIQDLVNQFAHQAEQDEGDEEKQG
ncbi:MAG: hypothetical protein WB975_14375, partial [Nitrososphaeraceae archaeon]